MYLNELTIHGFRGFPKEEHTLTFSSDSGVIIGDNGTGKSSILAAIEFLLTGGMTHLSGPGTGSIEVPTHAPHQNADPSECFVRGSFVSNNGDEGVFERRGDDHRNLDKLEGELATSDVEVSQWNDEHLLLTRGELLEFIESPPKSRAEQLSSLLNLSGITNRTQGFDRVSTKLEESVEQKRSVCERLSRDIDSVIEPTVAFPLDEETIESILTSVNERLTELEGKEIDDLDQIREGIESIDLMVAEESIDPFYESSTQNRISEVIGWVEDEQERINEELSDLSEDLGELQAVEDISLHKLDLFEIANEFITPETEVCPLCGETHDEGYLSERVDSERERLQNLRQMRDKVRNKRNDLKNDIEQHLDEIDELLDIFDGSVSEDHDLMDKEIDKIIEYREDLQELIETLNQNLIEQGDGSIEVTQISSKKSSPDWGSAKDSSEQILEYMGDLEPLEERSSIYSDLVTIENAWYDLAEELDELDHRKKLMQNMQHVEALFSESKQETFEDLYNNIEDSFNELYGTIHPDEQDIDLNFGAEGTESVELEATFQEERDSPLAYHSEGHIDTMGICLFLALRDHLNMSGPDLVMLDDIVMSVDKTHRRGVARMLTQYLENGPQAILATHDGVWSDQLIESGVVTRDNKIEITDWDISTGPALQGTSWKMIENYLDDDKPHAAAAHLRRQAEKLGAIAALRLEAKMTYKERYTLADYIYGISSKIKSVAKGAKQYYEDQSEEWQAAKDLDDQRSDLLGDFRLRELNSMVHYQRNEWGQLSVTDLRDVLEHWRAIDEFLHCPSNGEMVHYDESGDWAWIQCDCREIQVGYED